MNNLNYHATFGGYNMHLLLAPELNGISNNKND
jgi:hypothetical protein